MAVRRGKRRRRDRRQRDGNEGAWENTSQTADEGPKRPRRARPPRKTLADRSPVVPTIFALLCVLGAAYTASSYIRNPADRTNLIFAVFYAVLAVIEGYVAYRIRRSKMAVAKGSETDSSTEL